MNSTLATIAEVSDDRSLFWLYRRGLNARIGAVIIVLRPQPKKLDELIKEGNRIDLDLQNEAINTGTYLPRRMASGYSPNNFATSRLSVPLNDGGPRPMDIDANRRRIQVSNTNIRQGPLSENEKERRHANNLCLYCGRAGHLFTNCRAQPQESPTPSRNSYTRSTNERYNNAGQDKSNNYDHKRSAAVSFHLTGPSAKV